MTRRRHRITRQPSTLTLSCPGFFFFSFFFSADRRPRENAWLVSVGVIVAGAPSAYRAAWTERELLGGVGHVLVVGGGGRVRALLFFLHLSEVSFQRFISLFFDLYVPHHILHLLQ